MDRRGNPLSSIGRTLVGDSTLSPSLPPPSRVGEPTAWTSSPSVLALPWCTRRGMGRRGCPLSSVGSSLVGHSSLVHTVSPPVVPPPLWRRPGICWISSPLVSAAVSTTSGGTGRRGSPLRSVGNPSAWAPDPQGGSPDLLPL